MSVAENTKPKSLWRHPLARLCAFGFASLFIMAPTPGNVGGCSSSAGSEPVTAGDDRSQTPEYMYFDRGLCSAFCYRLYECGAICSALNPAHSGYPQGCVSDPQSTATGQAAFAQCVRATTERGANGETIDPLQSRFFGLGQCPHACPGDSAYHTAFEWDVQACSDAVLTRSCASSGGGSIGTTFSEGVSECTNVCQ